MLSAVWLSIVLAEGDVLNSAESDISSCTDTTPNLTNKHAKEQLAARLFLAVKDR